MTPKERIKAKKAKLREQRLRLKESNKVNNTILNDAPKKKKKKRRRKRSIKGQNGILYDESLFSKMNRMNTKYAYKSWETSGKPVKKVKDVFGNWVAPQ